MIPSNRGGGLLSLTNSELGQYWHMAQVDASWIQVLEYVNYKGLRWEKKASAYRKKAHLLTLHGTTCHHFRHTEA